MDGAKGGSRFKKISDIAIAVIRVRIESIKNKTQARKLVRKHAILVYAQNTYDGRSYSGRIRVTENGSYKVWR